MTHLAPPGLAERLQQRARQLLASRCGAEALPLLTRLRALPDAPPAALALEAEALLMLGRAPEAEAALAPAMAQAGDDATLLMLRGRIRLALHQQAPALDDLAAAVMRAPGDITALTLLGQALLDAGRGDEAVFLLGEAFQANPSDPAALAGLGQAFLRTGRHQAAEELLAAGEAGHPRRADIIALRAQNRLLAGDAAAAAALAEAALHRGLAAAGLHSVLAHALVDLGRLADAAPHFTAAARLAPGNAYLGHLAAAAEGAAPLAAAPAYVAQLFDGYAPHFEAAIFGLGYRVPGLLRQAVARHLPHVAAGRAWLGPVLDLGCGTGLAGVMLSEWLGAGLVGVDLSAGMLAEAAAKGLYTALRQAEIDAAMAADPASYALVIAADVFCYLGPLEGVLTRCRERLAPGGLLLFSLQLGDGAAWQLATDGRYRHGPAGLRAALAAAGLEVVEWREEVLRQEAGADVPGLLIVARARGH